MYFFTAVVGRAAKGNGLYFNNGLNVYTEKIITNSRSKYQ